MPPLCINTLLKIHGKDIDTSPGGKWKNMASTLGVSSAPPWSQLMPSFQYKSYVKNLIKQVIECTRGLSQEFYMTTWLPCGGLFASLRPAKVDSAQLKQLLESDPVGRTSLETFKPSGGFAQPVVYDRFGTRTGRLTVRSGPNILTLRKDHKGIIKSYYPSGSIVSLDFSSLEARVILQETDVEMIEDDIYLQISQRLFDGRIPRDVVKVAVLSELYGASKATLGHRLEMGGAELDSFVSAIRSYFRTDDLKARLMKQHNEEKRIHNRYGRPLFFDVENPSHLLINTYAQSTGVDVSLLGFTSVVNDLGPDGVRPLFILHDALILDVREDRMADVAAIKKIAVPGYRHHFPVKAEILR